MPPPRGHSAVLSQREPKIPQTAPDPCFPKASPATTILVMYHATHRTAEQWPVGVVVFPRTSADDCMRVRQEAGMGNARRQNARMHHSALYRLLDVLCTLILVQSTQAATGRQQTNGIEQQADEEMTAPQKHQCHSWRYLRWRRTIAASLLSRGSIRAVRGYWHSSALAHAHFTFCTLSAHFILLWGLSLRRVWGGRHGRRQFFRTAGTGAAWRCTTASNPAPVPLLISIRRGQIHLLLRSGAGGWSLTGCQWYR